MKIPDEAQITIFKGKTGTWYSSKIDIQSLVNVAEKRGYAKGYRAGREYAMIRTRKMVANWIPTTYSPEQIEEGKKC